MPGSSTFNYKTQYTQQNRQIESLKLQTKYPDRIAVIVHQSANSGLPPLDKHKFLVPKDITCGQFMHVLRKRLVLKAEQALFTFFGKNELVKNSELMQNVYDQHKDEDGFLYAIIQAESTFGGTS